MGRKVLALASAVLVAFSMLVFAVSSTTKATGNASGSVTLAANVITTSAITVEIDSQATNVVSINATPVNGAAFKESDEATITIASNNRTGIQASMVVDSPNLVHSADSSYYISSLAESVNGYTASDFPANTWGIALKNGSTYNNYFGISTGVTPMFETNAPATSPQTFKIGTKIDTSLIPGEYSTTVSIVAIAKPALYMQDVAYWKDSVAIGESLQAIDRRDMKAYWVTRIKTDPAIPDSRADCTGTGASRVCSQLWMTQNLDLDLSTNTTLTHYDTDLGWVDGDTSAHWTPLASTMNDLNEVYAELDYDDCDASYSDSVDKFYYYGGGNDYQTLTLSECEAMLGINAADCYHYHSGNYYTGLAAVAIFADTQYHYYDTEGYINTTNYDTYPNSVCPAGWKLPLGVSSANDYSDFDYLLYYNSVTADHGNTYIIRHDESNPDYYAPYIESVGYATHLYGDSGTETDGYYNTSTYPLWFNRPGYIRFNEDWSGISMYEPGKSAKYFSSSNFFLQDGLGDGSGQTYGANFIYHLHIYDDDRDYIAPAAIDDYYELMSVRCLAR